MGEQSGGRYVRFATAGIIAWSLGLVARLLYVGLLQSAPGTYAWQVAATAVYLPCMVVLLLRAAHGVRPRSSWWLLAGATLAILGTLPFGGVIWVPTMSVLAGLLLIYAPPPWSVVLFAAVVVVAVIAVLLGSGAPLGAIVRDHWPNRTFEFVTFDTVDVIWGGLALAVLVWLVRVIRELEGARQQLAARAIIAERRRIDDEVDRTVGAALERIIAAAELTASLVPTDRVAAARELSALTGRSRSALAQARGMLSGYREVSLEAELRAATTLLAAAGIRAELSLPDAELPAQLPEQLAARLRVLIADTLSSRVISECVLAITASPTGRLGIELIAHDREAREGAA